MRVLVENISFFFFFLALLGRTFRGHQENNPSGQCFRKNFGPLSETFILAEEVHVIVVART